VAYNNMGKAEANMGIALGDVDGDGLLDLFVTHLSGERHRLWKQGPRGQFRDQTFAAGLAKSEWHGTGFGTVLADFDGDGALDLVVTCVAGPARVYRNVAPKSGHWLLVRALDPALRRDAYGAEVTVKAGPRRWLGLVNPGSSYLCSNDPRAHFGLGAAA